MAGYRRTSRSQRRKSGSAHVPSADGSRGRASPPDVQGDAATGASSAAPHRIRHPLRSGDTWRTASQVSASWSVRSTSWRAEVPSGSRVARTHTLPAHGSRVVGMAAPSASETRTEAASSGSECRAGSDSRCRYRAVKTQAARSSSRSRGVQRAGLRVVALNEHAIALGEHVMVAPGCGDHGGEQHGGLDRTGTAPERPVRATEGPRCTPR